MSNENLPAAPQEKDNYVFANENSFVVAQRMASPLAKSTLVPSDYRDNIGNCLIALEIAQRLKASPLLIMQNLFVIEGRPSWSAQFLISTINTCGRYSPLRFVMNNKGEKDVECVIEYKWETGSDGRKKKTPVTGTIKIHDISCVAWALEKETGERLESSEISIEMAVKEGWYQKNGSKWKTMPEQMLRYRAASFFARIYSPELTMGMQTVEEVRDSGEIRDVTPTINKASAINDLLQQQNYDTETGEITDVATSRNQLPVENPTIKESLIVQNQEDIAKNATTEEIPLTDRVNSMIASIHMDNEAKGTDDYQNVTDSDEFKALWAEVKASGDKVLLGNVSAAMGV